jgi:uncharacterized protein (DUF2141 family)
MKLPFSLLVFICSMNMSAQKFSLTVTASGFPDNVGQAYMGLYRAQDDFPVVNKQYIGKVVAISKNSASVTYTNLTKGNYAVAVFHDRNKDGILNTNLFGVPTEEYGFSNNARNTFSAPSFSAASFAVSANKSISINVK